MPDCGRRATRRRCLRSVLEAGRHFIALCICSNREGRSRRRTAKVHRAAFARRYKCAPWRDPLSGWRKKDTSMAKSSETEAQVPVEIAPQAQVRILAEALPALINYDEETVVIKFGGNAMGDEKLAEAFAKDI